VPELDVGPVDGIRLHGQVHGHVGPLVAHHHDQAGVGHDQRVRFHVDHRLHIAQIGLQLGVVGKDVAGHEELLAACVGAVYAFLQRIQSRKSLLRTRKLCEAGPHTRHQRRNRRRRAFWPANRRAGGVRES
jgi:hypothetical protein